jgi:hypothetical protein
MYMLIVTQRRRRSKMVSKAALVALVLVALALVAGAVAAGASGRAVPVRRAEQSLGWMNGMKAGPPSGMQPSVVTAATTPERPTMTGNYNCQLP